ALSLLFGEAPSRIVVSLAPEHWEALVALAAERKVVVTRLGTTGGDALHLEGLLNVPVRELRTTWHNGLRLARGPTAPEPPPPRQASMRKARATSAGAAERWAEELRVQLVAKLKQDGVLRDAAVERALAAVPRHTFLPETTLGQAYADNAIPTHWED